MRILIAVILLCACSAGLGAQNQAVATSNVNVRSGQSKSSRILDELSEGDTVTLLSRSLRRGYYHIQEASGTQGWVYSRYIEVLAASAESTQAGAPTGGGGAATAIDASWDKPDPQSSLFSRSGFADCPAAGGTGDTLTDLRKNRTDEPTSYHPVSFDAILSLPYPKNHKPQRTSWSSAALDTIKPYEGIAVSVTAFIARQNGIIVENAQHSQNGEATNCHATDDAGVDWHITLVKNPNDPKSTGIVVETTPRVRANGHPWTPAMLAPHVTAGDSIRMSGWLLFDPEHFAQTTNYDPDHPSGGTKVRATLWEVHPVTRIEVFDSATNQWKTLP